MNKWKVVALVGAVLLVGALVWLYGGDEALGNGRSLSILLPDQDEQLAATYYPGDQEAGLILLPGFGSDQVAMRSMASEFAQAGVHVLTIDFSGHGRSPGGIGFDNAQTDLLAQQLLAAMAQFQAESGLNADQIILMGHSMGARVALQAMTMTDDPALGLILLGAQVNLTPNQQAEVFTGVSDTDLAWVQSLGAAKPAADVLLVTGAWDDILPPASAERLLAQLRQGDAADFSRDLVLFDALVHNYEIYSPRVLTLAKTWAGERWGLALPDSSPTASRRILLWLEGVAGLFLLALGIWGWMDTSRKTAAGLASAPDQMGTEPVEVRPAMWPLALTSLRKFLVAKLLFWLLAVPFILLVGGAMAFVPLGLPAFNLYYVACLGGYGLLLGLCYWRGWMPGVEGRLVIKNGRLKRFRLQSLFSDFRFWAALAVGAVALAVTAVFTHTGLFGVVTGQRLVWLLIFTPLTALAFAMGFREMQMVNRDAPGKKWALAATAVIGLIPFFLYTLFLGLLGSISGMLAGLQGLVILAFVLLLGIVVQRVGERLWLTSVLQAMLLYWLVLPVGPLFVM